MNAPADFTPEQLTAALAGRTLSLIPNRARCAHYAHKLFRVRKSAAALARMRDPDTGDGHTTVSIDPQSYARMLCVAGGSEATVRAAVAYAAVLLHGHTGKAQFSKVVHTRALSLISIGWTPGMTEEEAEAAVQARENNAAWERA